MNSEYQTPPSRPSFILFVMTPGAQTTGNIAVYCSAKQLVI